MTFGTGGFLMLNTGTDKVISSHQLLSTIAFEIDGKTQFSLEGSLFMAGASVQWLKDGIGILITLPKVRVLRRRFLLTTAFTWYRHSLGWSSPLVC